MLKIAICDDEEYFLEFEERLISNYMQTCGLAYEITAFTSGVDLLRMWDETAEFDIVFLDIGMEELNGIDTAKRIRKLSRAVYLVFVTVHINYVLQGYEVRATRFILKDNKFFHLAMKECMDAIIQEMNYTEQKQNFKFREGNVELAFDDIMYIESIAHKLYFRVVRNSTLVTFTMYEKLDAIEDMLQDKFFCRIHKSYLVNLKYVAQVERYELKLRNGTYLSISQPRYKDVSEVIIQYMGKV